MRSSALYLRVGLLVLVGLLLATGFVVFLLGKRSGGPMVTLETYSRESVQGLDVGASVRYRGVPIGRVLEIGLASAEYRRPERAAHTEAFQLVVIRFAVDPARIGEVPTAQEAIAMGLRARISSQGITGVNYIELDFVNPDRFPLVSVPWTPRYPVVPAIPSTVAQMRGAAETLVERLTQMPIEQIVTDMAALIGGLSRQANDGDLATTLRNLAQIAAQLRVVMDSGALEALLANELRRTTQRLPATIDGMERTLRTGRHATTDIHSELVPILADLRATTASLRATAESLRASPSQSIFGAPPPAPERRR
jgi:ABC-type transporter Mla subunit MlaD